MSPTPVERLKKLCDLAVAMGHINFSQADEALGLPVDPAAELGRALVDKGWITVDQLRELQKEIGRWEGSTNRYATASPGAAPAAEPFGDGRPAAPLASAPKSAPPVEAKKDQFLEDIINRRRQQSDVEPARPAGTPDGGGDEVSAAAVGASVGRAVNMVVGRPTMAVGGFLQRQWKLVAGIAGGLVVLIVAIVFISGRIERAGEISALLGAARKAAKEENYDEARKKYAEVNAMDPGNAEAAADLKKIEDDLTHRTAAAADAAAKQRDLDRATQKLDQARNGIEQAYRIYSFDEGDPKELQREAEDAERDIHSALEKLPETPEMHLLLGHSWLLRGSEEKAEAEWRKAIGMKADYVPAHVEIGKLLFMRVYTATALGAPAAGESKRLAGWTAEAVAELDHHKSLADGIQKSLAGLMIDHLKGNGEAVQFRAVVAIEKVGSREGVFELHWMAGLSALTSEKRMDYLNEAVKRCPNHPVVLYSRAKEREKEKNYKGALADYSRALKMSPGFSAAYAARAQVRFLLGEPKEAAADYQKALDTAPADWVLRAKVKAAMATSPSPSPSPTPTTSPKPSPKPSPTGSPKPSPSPSPKPSPKPTPKPSGSPSPTPSR